MIDIDRSLAFYSGALRGLLARQRVAMHNIANADTPGYHAKDVPFETVLLDVIRNHRDPEAVTFPAVEQTGLQEKANGNNVDLEREWVRIEETRLLHEVFARASGGSLRTMLEAIRSR